VLPLQVGNTWTYEAVQARDGKGTPIVERDDMKKLRPLPAIKIVVTVTAVDKKEQEATVKLKETITYDITKGETKKLFDQVVESTIVCSPKGKFDISPQSFFFAGEPGGFRGINFSRFERKKETTLKLTNGTIGETEWIEEISAEYQKEPFKGSNAKLSGGKLDMERKFTPLAAEGFRSRKLEYPSAEKLHLRTSGRVVLDTKVAPDGKPCTKKTEVKKTEEEMKADAARKGDELKKAEDAFKAEVAAKPDSAKTPDEKKAEEAKKAALAKLAEDAKKIDDKKIIEVPTDVCELPADWDSDLWLTENVGFVQTLNHPWAHMYQLVEVTLN